MFVIALAAVAHAKHLFERVPCTDAATLPGRVPDPDCHDTSLLRLSAAGCTKRKQLSPSQERLLVSSSAGSFIVCRQNSCTSLSRASRQGSLNMKRQCSAQFHTAAPRRKETLSSERAVHIVFVFHGGTLPASQQEKPLCFAEEVGRFSLRSSHGCRRQVNKSKVLGGPGGSLVVGP